MRATKHFFVVAYDTPSTKRRRQIIKVIEPYGKRINFSVYEVMVTPAQYFLMVASLTKIIIKDLDQVAIYRICVECFTKIRYLPDTRERAEVIKVL